MSLGFSSTDRAGNCLGGSVPPQTHPHKCKGSTLLLPVPVLNPYRAPRPPRLPNQPFGRRPSPPPSPTCRGGRNVWVLSSPRPGPPLLSSASPPPCVGPSGSGVTSSGPLSTCQQVRAPSPRTVPAIHLVGSPH